MLYPTSDSTPPQIMLDIKSGVLSVVLRFIYTGTINISDIENADDFYRAASLLKLPRLIDTVEEVADLANRGLDTGTPCQDLRWDQTRARPGVCIHDNGRLVELPAETPNGTIRTALVPIPAGMSKWAIIVESVGMYDDIHTGEIGLVGEAFICCDTTMCNKTSTWTYNWRDTYIHGVWEFGVRRRCAGALQEGNTVTPQKGDTVTFQLDRSHYTCVVTINNQKRDIEWTRLPDNFHFAVTLHPGSSYRII
jgi:BTB/POZ domain